MKEKGGFESVAASDGELRALAHLLDDDSEYVRSRVTARLREIVASQDERLREIVRGLDGYARERLRPYFRAGVNDNIVSQFAELAGQERFDLEAASYLLARTAYPELDESACRSRLDDLANDAAAVCTTDLEPGDAAARFAGVLYGDGKLNGCSHEQYYDPDNSYVNRVLERGIGIPISLSAIGLFVARRAELPVIGIGMPTHFVLAWEHPEVRVLVNPFRGGEIVTPEECRTHLDRLRIAWRDEFLMRTPDQLIMFRMLANLITIFQQTDRQDDAELLGRLAVLVQDDPSGT